MNLKMPFRRIKITQLNFIVLIMVFPGYFFYSVLASLGILGLSNFNYWTNVMLISFLVIFCVFLYKIRSLNLFDFVFLFFLLFYFFWNVFFIATSPFVNEDVAKVHLFSLVQFFTIYFCFRFLNLSGQNSIIILNLTIAIAVVIIVLPLIGIPDLRFLSFTTGVNPENIASYQAVALIFLILLVLTLNYVKSGFYRFFLIFISLYALFLNGSRSELLALVTVISFFEVMRLKSHTLRVLFFAFIVVSVFIFAINIEEIAGETRLAKIGIGLGDDSVSQRIEILNNGLEVINDNFLEGSFASYERGHYIHNIFSVWFDLGLFGFFIFLLLHVISILILVKKYFLERIDFFMKNSLCLMFFFSSMLLVAFAKPFTFLLVPISLAFISQEIKIRSKRNENSSYL